MKQKRKTPWNTTLALVLWMIAALMYILGSAAISAGMWELTPLIVVLFITAFYLVGAGTSYLI